MQNGKKGEFSDSPTQVKNEVIKDFRKAYLKLVEEKVTGDDEASQALVSPHDIDELERVRELENKQYDYGRFE